MILKLLLAVILLIVFFSLIHKYKKSAPAQRRSLMIKIVIGAVIIAIVIGSLTGRVPLLAGLIAVVATLGKFGLRWGLPAAKLWLAKSGGNATFRSEFLVVSVNVTSGQLVGEVIKGEFSGRSLGELDDQQLQNLLKLFSNSDKKSYYLLSAYIRSRGFTAGAGAQNQQSSNRSNMTSSNVPDIEEALEILGFKTTPTKKEIIDAHRRLISKLHPDKGGTDYLAARVNQARDVLLESIK